MGVKLGMGVGAEVVGGWGGYHPTALVPVGGGLGRKPVWFDLGIYCWFLGCERGKGGGIRSYPPIPTSKGVTREI